MRLHITKHSGERSAKDRGISSLEYMVLLSMVISILCFIAGPNGFIQGVYENLFKATTEPMVQVAQKIPITIGGGGDAGLYGAGTDVGSGFDGIDSDRDGGRSVPGPGSGGPVVEGGFENNGPHEVVTTTTTTTTRTYVFSNSRPVVYAPEILDALNLLNGTSAGQYFYDLIQNFSINVIYDDFSKYSFAASYNAFWWGVGHNKIYVNQDLRTTRTAKAVASIIVHEATHADFDYNTETRIAETLARHPELDRSKITTISTSATWTYIHPVTGERVTQPYVTDDSIDQEYVANKNELTFYSQVRGNDADPYSDYELALMNQGEGRFKSYLRSIPAYSELPEY